MQSIEAQHAAVAGALLISLSVCAAPHVNTLPELIGIITFWCAHESDSCEGQWWLVAGRGLGTAVLSGTPAALVADLTTPEQHSQVMSTPAVSHSTKPSCTNRHLRCFGLVPTWACYWARPARVCSPTLW